MTGPVALVGSGEYLPVMDGVERALLEGALAAGRPNRFVQLATAAAPEGPASLARWHALGAQAAERIGVQQVVVPVVGRADADDPALAARCGSPRGWCTASPWAICSAGPGMRR